MLSKISPLCPAIGIVSIGGGTGLCRLLSGLKHFVPSTDSKLALAMFDACLALDRLQAPLPASASAQT